MGSRENMLMAVLLLHRSERTAVGQDDTERCAVVVSRVFAESMPGSVTQFSL